MSRHCKACGWHDLQRIETRGSDTIPVSECQSCGETQAVACACDMPLEHRQDGLDGGLTPIDTTAD